MSMTVDALVASIQHSHRLSMGLDNPAQSDEPFHRLSMEAALATNLH
jgi:hypothetical protein